MAALLLTQQLLTTAMLIHHDTRISRFDDKCLQAFSGL